MSRSTAEGRIKSTAVVMIAIALLCWGRILFLKGIWWDDWAWVWHYLSSSGISDFVGPFKSLRHILDGFILYLNFKLLDLAPLYASNIWNVFKFFLYIMNAGLVYFIAKRLLRSGSMLPFMISVAYLTSPLVNNICLVELVRRIYLFFFLLSIFFSIKAVEGEFKPSYYLGAIAFSSLSMFGLESFVFFELARPLVTYSALSKKEEGGIASNIKRSMMQWIPFIAIGSIVLLYNTGVICPRSGVYANAYEPYRVGLIDYIIKLFKHGARSLFYLFTGNLYGLIKGGLLAKSDTGIAFASLSSALITAFFLLNKTKNGREREIRGYQPGLEPIFVLVFGIVVLLAGIFPYIAVRGTIAFGVESRHALLGAVGVALIMPAFLTWLFIEKHVSRFVFCLLFALFIFFNVFQCNMTAKAYELDWKDQVSFWDDFTKNVPFLKDGTYLVIDMPREEAEYFGKWRGSYEFTAPLNILYAKDRSAKELNKYFAESLKNALNPAIEWSYAANKDKAEGSYISYKGVQKFYTQNIMTASYHDNELRIHFVNDYEMRKNEYQGEYPLRWIIK